MIQKTFGFYQAAANIKNDLSALLLEVQNFPGNDLDAPHLGRRGHGLGDERPQVRLAHIG